MRIALNATCFDGQPSGAFQRFSCLYRQLIHIRPTDEFIIYQRPECSFESWADLPNVQLRPIRFRSAGRFGRWIEGLTVWRKQLLNDQIDHLEQFHFPVARSGKVKTQVTVHDVRLLHGNVLQRLVGRWLYPAMVRRTDNLLTVSDTMLKEIGTLWPSCTTRRVYNGIDLDQWRDTEAPGRDPSLILSVGHLEPRKNYPRLIEAMPRVLARFPDTRLVVVGRDAGEQARLRNKIARLHLVGHVTLMTDTSDDQLRNLYRTAGAFAFPSRYEGFGIPLVEALASGLPAAVSDIDIFREIAGSCALYFDPDNASDIADALIRLRSDDALRSSQADNGHRRASMFDYRILAMLLSQAIDDIHANSSMQSGR